MKYLPTFFFLCVTISNTAFAEDSLEEKTNEVIRSACHGFALDMIPDFLASLRTKLKKDSSLCKDVREQSDAVDIQTTLKRHLTQRDLDRIYGQPWSGGGDPIAFECKQEWKCGKVRKDLIRRNKSMSQKQYDQVAEYCRGDPAVYDCIDAWVNKEWIAKGVRTVPKRKLQDVGGVSIDDLMSPKSSHTPAVTGSIDDLMGGATPVKNSQTIGFQPKTQQTKGLDDFASLGTSSKSDLTKGEVGFDNIYTGQKQIKINGIKQHLFDKGETIASKCQCAFRHDSCFESRSYDYEQLTSAFNKTDKNLEAKKASVCSNWKSVLRGKTSDSETTLNIYLKNSDVILRNLDKLDKGYDSVVTALNDKESEIKREIRRRQQQQEQQGGFDWAKFAALGTGVLIGGSGGGMSSADMTRLLAGAAQDSMEGIEGISNFNQGIQEVTNQRIAQMQSISKVNQQVRDINAGRSVTQAETIQFEPPVQKNIARVPQSSNQKQGGVGAIAFSRNNNSSIYGLVTNKGSESVAKSAVLAQCGSSCGVARVFKGCGAAVIGTQPNGIKNKYFNDGDATSRSDAENNALGTCEWYGKRNNQTCSVVASGCN